MKRNHNFTFVSPLDSISNPVAVVSASFTALLTCIRNPIKHKANVASPLP